MVAALGQFYLEHSALYEKDFEPDSIEWPLNLDSASGIVAYLRRGSQETLLCIHNLLPKRIKKWTFSYPGIRHVKEVFNTDRKQWGGSDIMNSSLKVKDDAINLCIAPLATQIFAIDFAGNDHP